MNDTGEHQLTTLWVKTLAYRSNDHAEEARTRLRTAYESLRRNTSHLVAQIAKELPQLTLHDIRHLDALWNTADLIAGPEFELSPSEAFVFGGAILLHDAGHALATLKGGMEELVQKPEWRDAAISILESANYSPITDETIRKPPRELFEDILFAALRSLHSRLAETLGSLEFTNESTGTRLQLIEDATLRIHYGTIIGQIAASHNWEIEDLPLRLQNRVGALGGMPNDWIIDPVKIACLLRCADAAQIDSQRAPDFLFALLKLRGLSRNHWLAQNKLAQPVHDPDDTHALVYSSTSPYSDKEAEAWWVAFDLVSVINKELAASRTLLRDTQRKEFLISRVRDVETPTRLARHVTTFGWTPVHADVQISNSAGVAKLLGGEELYGYAPLVSIRELIQNAADAIRARRYFDKSDPEFEGRILIKLRSVQGKYYLDVLDDGVGMAQHTLVGPLIDLGTSLWKTRLLESEFPGLRGSAFRSVGKFGIGFYSVFMIADAVSVASKRFDQGALQGRTLVFANGLMGRPILLNNLPIGLPSSFQTMVSLTLKPEVAEKFIGAVAALVHPFYALEPLSFESILADLCPTLDCDVSLQIEDHTPKKIHDRRWYEEDGEKWLRRLFRPGSNLSRRQLNAIAEAARRLSLIRDGDQVVGRAALSIQPSTFFDADDRSPERLQKLLRTSVLVCGQSTVGGLSTDSPNFVTGTNAFWGAIDGRAIGATRYVHPLLLRWSLSDIFQYPEQKQAWIKDQLAQLQLERLNGEESDALRENLARFGEVQPSYFAFRIFDSKSVYEKLTDMPVVELPEISEGLSRFEINIPTAEIRAGKEVFQRFEHFDRGDLRLLSLVLSQMSLSRWYFPIIKDSAQIRIPKNLNDENGFSGVLAALLRSLREKGYQCSLSIKEIPKPKGADRAILKRFESKLSRLLTIRAAKT